jgi:uncharacterized protein YlbG (UPF0298 family)
MKKELSHGFSITDNRSLGCGVQIENKGDEVRIGMLSYSSRNGVYINLYGTTIQLKDIENYIDQLNVLNQVLTEANKFLKEKSYEGANTRG